MFCVIYEFKIDENYTDEFKTIWHILTVEIKDHQGGLGSRLHQSVDQKNLYIAYAQWPTKEAWEKYAPLNTAKHEALTDRLREICHQIGIVYQLDVIDDLLVHHV